MIQWFHMLLARQKKKQASQKNEKNGKAINSEKKTIDETDPKVITDTDSKKN